MEIKKGVKVTLKKYEDLSEELKDDLEEANGIREYLDIFSGKTFTVASTFKAGNNEFFEVEEDEELTDIQKAIVRTATGRKCTKVHSLVKEFVDKIEMPIQDIAIDSLEETVDMMLSMDYKERFKAEYYQLKIRKTKLQRMYDNWDSLSFTPTCDKDTYKTQLTLMNGYLAILEERAKKERIEL